jgi:hypothetical protein
MYRKLALAGLLFIAAPVWSQGPVIPTVPVQQVYDDMNQAAEAMNELPDDVTEGNLPDSPDPVILFGYVRWVFSYNTAQELLGQKMAPLGLALFHFLMVLIPLLGIYVVINAVTITIKFAMWVFSIIVKLLELIPIFQ